MDQKSVRSNNLALVFRQLLEKGPRSRATLAQETGLNKTTVSSLVAELIENGMLVETEIERAKVGRPAQMLDVNGDQILGLGLEISADYVAVCLKDLFGRVIAERFETANNRQIGSEALARRLGGLAQDVLRQWLDDESLLAGATVAVPGLVEADGMTVLRAPELALEHAAVGEAVAAELAAAQRTTDEQLPVRIEKDANLGALAELNEGAARDLSEFVYLSGGAGVSAGIVVGGQLIRGSEGFAGEVGHLPVAGDGPACWCGAHGCLAAVMREGLVELVGTERFASSPSDTMNVIYETVSASVRQNDAKALRILDRLADHLGVGLAAVVHLLNPQAVVLGGYFSVLSEWLLEPAAERMRAYLAAREATSVQLRVAVLGGYAPLRGAALDALGNVVADPRVPAHFGAGDESLGGVGAEATETRGRDSVAHRRSMRRLSRRDPSLRRG